MASSHRDEISKLESLYAEHPEGRVFTHLAEAYRKAGELDRAREILEKGIPRHPDYPSAHVVLGRVLLDLGDDEGAREAFERVLDLDQHNLIALRALGDLAKRAGDVDEAVRLYQQLMALDPGDEALEEELASLEAGTAVEDAGATATVADDPEETDADAGDTGAEGAVADPAAFEPVAFDDAGLEGGAPESGGDEEAPGGDAFDLVADFQATSLSVDPDEVSDGEAYRGLGGEPAGAVVDDAAAEAAAAESEEPDPAPVPDEDAGGAPSNGGVVTETMAELYTRQGLYREAADVYRELSARRPGDARLQGKLADVEALAQAAGEMAPAADDAAPQDRAPAEPTDPAEPAEPVDPAEVTGEAAPETDASRDDDPAPAEVDWSEWQELASEISGAASAEPAPAEDDDAAGLPELDTALEGPEGVTEEVDVAAEAGTEEEVQVADAGVSESAEAAADPAETDGEAETLEAAWTAGAGAAGDEATPYAWPEEAEEPESAPAEEAGPTTRDYFRDLLAWRPAEAVGEPSPVEADAAPVVEAAELEPDPVADPVGGGDEFDQLFADEEAADAAPEAGAPEAAGDDDDDLEAFREWLQSLKD